MVHYIFLDTLSLRPMEKHRSIMRLCIACGKEKPLAAFLYLSGEKGTTYGRICSDCRSRGIKEKKSSLLKEEDSGTISNLRIGAKQKLEIEKEKKRQFRELKDAEIKEAKKREKISTDKINRAKETLQSEKKHRQKLFLDKSTQTFITQQTKPLETSQAIEIKQKEFIDQQLKIVAGDGVRVTEFHYNSPVFLQFVQWLHASSPLSATVKKEKMNAKKESIVKQSTKSLMGTEKKSPKESVATEQPKPTKTRFSK